MSRPQRRDRGGRPPQVQFLTAATGKENRTSIRPPRNGIAVARRLGGRDASQKTRHKRQTYQSFLGAVTGRSGHYSAGCGPAWSAPFPQNPPKPRLDLVGAVPGGMGPDAFTTSRLFPRNRGSDIVSSFVLASGIGGANLAENDGLIWGDRAPWGRFRSKGPVLSGSRLHNDKKTHRKNSSLSFLCIDLRRPVFRRDQGY